MENVQIVQAELQDRIVRHAHLLWQEAGSPPGPRTRFVQAATEAELALRQPAELEAKDKAADPASFAGF